jgi:hypothetical protein
VVADAEDKTPAERYGALRWAQRLKRVFNLDIERCEHCGGAMKILAAIEDPTVIAKILQHLETHPPRGPPHGDAARGECPAG